MNHLEAWVVHQQSCKSETLEIEEDFLNSGRQHPAALHWCKSFPAFEALLHVSVDTLGIFGFTQDFQQVVVGQEKEAREEQSFGLQVVVEA